jgi:hypothetical protein
MFFVFFMFLLYKNAILVTLKQIQKKEEEHTWKNQVTWV